MTTPALQRLRERFPRASITLLSGARLSDLWLLYPGINRVITFDRGENIWSVSRRLRKERFDVALIFPNSLRSALEVWLAGIPGRIGYAGNCRSSFLTQPVDYPRDGLRLRRLSVREVKHLIRPNARAPVPPVASHHKHQVHDYLGLAAVLGANPSPLTPSLKVAPEEITAAMAVCLSTALPENSIARPSSEPFWLGINPSAAYGPAKCWPLESFVQVARDICNRFPNALWLGFGTPDQRHICQRIADSSGVRAINLAGKTSLRQLMALLAKCRVLLTNDSGPMHVAAALGVPVVVPFGSTSPELTGPGFAGDPRHLLLRGAAPCAPCFRRTCPIDFRCMMGIVPEQVIQALLQVLDDRANRG